MKQTYFSSILNILIFLLSGLKSDFDGMVAKQEGQLDTFNKTEIIVVILISVMNIAICVICLLGIYRNIPHYVYIYLVYNLIYIVVIILLLLASVITGHDDLELLFWHIISILLYVYFYLVVRTLFFLWIFLIYGFPTIDISHTRAAHLSRTANLRRRIFIAHLTAYAQLYNF
ncbi:hypothetical protein SFRURICE_006607 [Spodoptera frugiperda]|nr:hypothetical protein SFRURICE_006607 [Spodoptera frugiperda]